MHTAPACFLKKPVYRQGAVFETVGGMAVEEHNKQVAGCQSSVLLSMAMQLFSKTDILIMHPLPAATGQNGNTITQKMLVAVVQFFQVRPAL